MQSAECLGNTTRKENQSLVTLLSFNIFLHVSPVLSLHICSGVRGSLQKRLQIF